MIKIEDLRLDFPGRLNLRVDKLLIEKGRIFTIIGPNGAGKSTFLNIMALFQKPDSGIIEIWGENILETKDRLSARRKTSFIFSQPYLFNETVYDNIALPLRLRGIDDLGAVDEMLDLFHIGPLKAHRALSLSQGEKHRVALARSFVTKPQLLLMDEPFLSLETRYKEALMSQLRSIILNQAITAIFVTQDHSEALSLADEMAFMDKGRILQQGRPQEIFTRPAAKQVADFIGIETILAGRVISKTDNLCFIKAGDNILEAVSAYEKGDDVFVCIRPEDVIISKHAEDNSARNHFKAIITHLEPWRLEYKLTLDCGFVLMAVVTKQSIENMDLRIGQNIFVSFKATAIHLIKR